MNKEATVRLGSQLYDIQLLKQVDDILDSVIDSYVLTKKEMLFDEDDDRILRAYTFSLRSKEYIIVIHPDLYIKSVAYDPPAELMMVVGNMLISLVYALDGNSDE